MERIEKALNEARDKGLLRTLQPIKWRKNGIIKRGGKELIDFSSNDYLGLSFHPAIIEASAKAAREWGTGSTGSRLLSGDLNIHHELEDKTALFKGTESALVFNSGYQANASILSTLCGPDDAVFADRLSHASILDGAALSQSRLFRFNHNDPGHLRELLSAKADNFKSSLIVTESVFSMDGDTAPLQEIVRIKERFGCMLLVDEAHATGLFGNKGSGMVELENLTERIDLIMGTFSKGLGSFGAYLAADKQMIQYMVNTARGFIYSTALPPAVTAANIAAIDIVESEPERREVLTKNTAFFREKLTELGLSVRGSTQIVPVILDNVEKAVELSNELEEKGFCALPIRPPTVPAHEPRVRFSLTTHHTEKVLTDLLSSIERSGICSA